MKRLTILCLVIALAACSPSAPKQNQAAPKVQNKTVYTCPMHPDVKADKPGVCPKCGMDLVEKND